MSSGSLHIAMGAMRGRCEPIPFRHCSYSITKYISKGLKESNGLISLQAYTNIHNFICLIKKPKIE